MVTLPMVLVLGIILVSLFLLMTDRAPPDLALLGAVILLVAGGVLSPEAALAGFANTGMLTVAALFVVAAGLRETGAVSRLTAPLLGRPRHVRGALTRLTLPVVAASAFLNNTTIVAALLPAVRDWARRSGLPASQLLLPLSFASIIGGTLTLVGTSTNLVVAGLVQDQLGKVDGLRPLGMFDITPVGFAVALVGSLVLIGLGPALLPDRRPAVSPTDDPREYSMELVVEPGSRLAGRTIEDAGLRHLPGAYLMEIVRGEELLPAVDGGRRLAEGDRLVFVGEVDAMVDLQRTPGLRSAGDQVFKLAGDRLDRRIVEAVISERNPLVGQSIREGNFRNRFQAVVIAVARAGQRLRGRIGDIVLQNGDVLLLETHRDFVGEQASRNNFYLVSAVEGATPPRFEKTGAALTILGALVLSVTFGLAATVTASFVAAGLTVLTRCCTLEEARRSIDLPVLVAIASAFGLGRAMQETGLDDLLAGLAVDAGISTPLGAVVIVYLLTAAVTEVITNNAAAVLAFPVALALAEQVGAPPMALVFTVMMAASASFITPIGYQTNLMVMGPGGYRGADQARLGVPMQVCCAAASITSIYGLWC
jgi:di/tricarboxylate transporter